MLRCRSATAEHAGRFNDDVNIEALDKDWLDAKKFPKATFVSSSVRTLGGGRYEARGPLTIKGTSQEVVVPLTVSEAAGMRTVDGQFPLKRLKYKIGEGPWSDTDTVADEVLVRFRFTLPTK